ncbi:MAG: hypothetical protein ACTSUO_09325 [Candidatus Thorarchaeota archaeon]
MWIIRLQPKVILLMIVVAGTLSGFMLPKAVYLSSRMDENLIPLPGTPLNETIFSPLVSDTPHPAIYRGNWSVLSQDPYRLELDLMESIVSQEEAKVIAESFIDPNLATHLTYAGPIRVYSNDMNRWCFAFQNRTSDIINVLVWITVSSISGIVIGYEEVWNRNVPSLIELDPFSPFQDNAPISETQSNEIAVTYLVSKGYTLGLSARYMRTTPIPTDEHLSEILETNNATSIENLLPDLYEIVLSIPNEKVFPDTENSGIRIAVGVYSGRVERFYYDVFEIPLIDINQVGVLNVYAARNEAMNSESPVATTSNGSYGVWDYGILRLVRRDSVWESSIEFQLAWTFRIVSQGYFNVEIGGEIAVDAISGRWRDLHPSIYFASVENIQNPILIVTTIISGSFVFAIICFQVYKKRLEGSL